MFGLADAEADAERQVRLGAQPGELVEELRWQLLASSRDAGDTDDVEEAGRLPGDAHGAVARRGRRHELDEFEVACLSSSDQGVSFFDGQVRYDRPAETGSLGLLNKRGWSGAVDQAVRQHPDQRRPRLGSDPLGNGIENTVELQSVGQGARVGGLNYGPVRNGVAVGE